MSFLVHFIKMHSLFLQQNIDGLEHMAEIPEEKLVECHGHFRTASCTGCGASADIRYVKKTIVVEKKAPKCQSCRKAYVKPDIVFFGEQLPNRFHRVLPSDLEKADLCLILGTSLQVPPVARIPYMVNCQCVLLNREHVGGIDVFHGGDCDDSVMTLAKLLGWQDELLEKNQRTRKQAQQNSSAESKDKGAKDAETKREKK